MSDTQETKGGWLKAILGALAGLFSGALVMYLTPLVDRVVKPAKPIANFAVESQGLTVNFMNRSTGANEARWDFGDGTPLEFVAADQSVVAHTYKKPGTYVAKLIVANLLGEEDERTVTVDLAEEAPKKSAEKPAIVDLQVRPPGRSGEPVYAPATYQFQATADNASYLIWDFGDGKGLHMGDAAPTYTFDRPGTYRIRLCAFNGSERDDEERVIEVAAPPAGMLRVNLTVADEGLQVERRRREVPVSQLFELTKNKKPGNGTPDVVVPALPGFTIVSFERVQSNNDNLEKAEWKLGAEGKLLKCLCTAKKGTANRAILNERIAIVEERKTKTSRTPIPVTAMVNAPGVVTLRLPPPPEDWSEVRRGLSLQLNKDEKTIWKGTDLPRDVQVNVAGRPYLLNASLSGDRLTIQLASRIAGN